MDRGETPQVIPEEDVEALETSVKEKVKDVIKNYVESHMSTWEKLSALLGNPFGLGSTDHDDEIGSGLWYWTTS